MNSTTEQTQTGVDPLFATILLPWTPPAANQLSDSDIEQLMFQESLPPNRITPLHASEQQEEDNQNEY